MADQNDVAVVVGAPAEQTMESPSPTSWSNISGSRIEYRSEPDLEKKMGMYVEADGLVTGTVEGEWLKTSDNMFLPMKHPRTGATLFEPMVPLPPESQNVSGTVADQNGIVRVIAVFAEGGPRETSWKNVSGGKVLYRTEPDPEKKTGEGVEAGALIKGTVKGNWLKTSDNMYVPMKHPVTGVMLFKAMTPTAPTAPSPGQWQNVSGTSIIYRTAPDLEMRAPEDPKLAEGAVVEGTREGLWVKTPDNLYLPMMHPTKGTPLLAPYVPGIAATPPPGCPPGGHWEDVKYFGPCSMILLCLLRFKVLCKPVDVAHVYIALDGRMYDRSGREFFG